MKTKEIILAACLGVAVISLVIQVICVIIDPETVSVPLLVGGGIVPVVICLVLLLVGIKGSKVKAE